MDLFWLIRMARWARRRPSRGMLIMVAGIVVFGLLLGMWEHYFGWPDALTVNSPRALRRPLGLAP